MPNTSTLTKEEKREHKNKIRREWYAKNREHYLKKLKIYRDKPSSKAKRKIYDKKNKERIAFLAKQLRLADLDAYNKKRRERYKKLSPESKERLLAKGREYRGKNKQKVSEYNKIYQKQNKAKHNEICRNWVEKNKDKRAKTLEEYMQSDSYYNQLLLGETNLPKGFKFPQVLIDLKREHVRLKRLLTTNQ
tara:strand:- start:791 stop:1363 length:573 start_codon:yes stop_codon:yes gene_type:complete